VGEREKADRSLVSLSSPPARGLLSLNLLFSFFFF